MIVRQNKIYRNRRHGRRVVQEYLGPARPALVELVRRQEERERQERRAAAGERARERAEWAGRDRAVASAITAARQAAAALLTARGYKLRKREWVKVSDKRIRIVDRPACPGKIETAEEASAALAAARAGDERAIALWAEQPPFKEGSPDLMEALGGHPGRNLRNSLVQLANPPDRLALVAGTRQARKLYEDLSQPGDTRLHRLAVEAVVTAWLNHHANELRWATVMREGNGASINQWARRVELSSRRYNRALSLLARLRRLLGGAPQQVNVASTGGTVVAQQVNEAGGGAGRARRPEGD